MRDLGSPERKETQRRSPWLAGPRAAFAFSRSLAGRLKRPEALLMVMAMLASLGAHMPPYVGLGALADYFASQPAPPESVEPVEVTFEVADEPVKKPAEETLAESEPPPEKERPKKPETKQAPPQPAPLARPKPKAPKKPVAEATPLPPAQEQRKQSITQKSHNPDEPAPDDAAYLAEENRTVEEQTVAKVTDEMRDDAELAEGSQHQEGPRELGDAAENERGATGGVQGDAPVEVARKAAPPPEPTPRERAQPRVTRREVRAAAPEVIQDPLGSFVLAPAQRAQQARKGRAGKAGSRPNLKVSWSAFEQTYGKEELASDRMPKLARSLGAGREKRWGEFKAAIENYVTGVKPGNTTALNARADAFAAYIAAFHRHLHMEFAYKFLSSLPMTGEFGDPSLVTKVEIVVNEDGSLDRVGVVKSSGNLMYDFGAFNAVQRGAPYPATPSKIRSADGRVYLHWALHRDASQCGTWNADRFILDEAPRSPNDPAPDNVSPYRRSPGLPADSKHGRAPERPRKALSPREIWG